MTAQSGKLSWASSVPRSAVGHAFTRAIPGELVPAPCLHMYLDIVRHYFKMLSLSGPGDKARNSVAVTVILHGLVYTGPLTWTF